MAAREEAKASEERRRVISWMRFFTSLALVDFDRSWLSLASRLGCRDTWTLEGRDDMAGETPGLAVGEKRRVEEKRVGNPGEIIGQFGSQREKVVRPEGQMPVVPRWVSQRPRWDAGPEARSGARGR